MGVLKDLVLANPEDAEAIAENIDWRDHFENMHGVDDVNLAYLLIVLRGWRPKFSKVLAEIKLLHQASDEGPWVQQAPKDFVDSMVSLNKSELSEVASRWLETGEFSTPNIDVKEAIDYLMQVQKFCKTAQKKKKSVLLWTCL